MLSTLEHLDQVQSLCSPGCADKSEQSSHHNSISLLHPDLLLPFLASTQRFSHTVHRPTINRVLSLHAYYFISIPLSLICSQAQFNNCCVHIYDIVNNMAKIYIYIHSAKHTWTNTANLILVSWSIFNINGQQINTFVLLPQNSVQSTKS
jgi:hypothetical protein